jgi:hypothetical protein
MTMSAEHMQGRVREKDAAIRGIDEAIKKIEPEYRQPDQWERVFLAADEVYNQYDIALLRQALKAAEAEPVQPFPHFGPIILT